MIKEISTDFDSFELYLLFQNAPYSFFLDSGMNHEDLGRFSFIGADPFVVFKSKGENIVLMEKGAGQKRYRGNPFDELQQLLNAYQHPEREFLPFIGGAVGYFAYDLCHFIEDLPRRAVDDMHLPDCYMGLYDSIVAVDHLTKKTYIAALGIREAAPAVIQKIEQKILSHRHVRPMLNVKKKQRSPRFTSNFTKEAYVKAIEKIREYISNGDIYQANMTQRFECELQETPLELYAKLRHINPAPFASYLDFGEGRIVSSSPERFLRIQDRVIETRPIKGTRPRGKTQAEDLANRAELVKSEKDRAELLMIVDLERNDLGKIAKIGTVQVPELFHVETYATVHHLVATITAEIREEYGIIDCIKAMFPGGSITGAPKIRSMEIIDELEPTQRNIYTGSIGYIGLNGDADLNIAIRTIICKDNRAYFQAGGGIVWDSDPVLEYEESLHKIQAHIHAMM